MEKANISLDWLVTVSPEWPSRFGLQCGLTDCTGLTPSKRALSDLEDLELHFMQDPRQHHECFFDV